MARGRYAQRPQPKAAPTPQAALPTNIGVALKSAFLREFSEMLDPHEKEKAIIMAIGMINEADGRYEGEPRDIDTAWLWLRRSFPNFAPGHSLSPQVRSICKESIVANSMSRSNDTSKRSAESATQNNARNTNSISRPQGVLIPPTSAASKPQPQAATPPLHPPPPQRRRSPPQVYDFPPSFGFGGFGFDGVVGPDDIYLGEGEWMSGAELQAYADGDDGSASEGHSGGQGTHEFREHTTVSCDSCQSEDLDRYTVLLPDSIQCDGCDRYLNPAATFCECRDCDRNWCTRCLPVAAWQRR